MILEINGFEATLVAEDEKDHQLLLKLADRFYESTLIEDTSPMSAALVVQADKVTATDTNGR
jgi:hypothetical protein